MNLFEQVLLSAVLGVVLLEGAHEARVYGT